MRANVKTINLKANYSKLEDEVFVKVCYDQTLTLSPNTYFDDFEYWVEHIKLFQRFIRKGVTFGPVNVEIEFSQYNEDFSLLLDETGGYTGRIIGVDENILTLIPDFIDTKDIDFLDVTVRINVKQKPAETLLTLAKLHRYIHSDKLQYQDYLDRQKEKEQSQE